MLSQDIHQLKQHLADSSRALADLTAAMVMEKPQLLDPIVDVMLSGESPFAQRAARVFAICCEADPMFFKPYRSVIINRLNGLRNEGVLRNVLKIVADFPVYLTKKDKSALINLCFEYLTGPLFAISIKAHAMQILYNLSREYPGIGPELYAVIDEQMSEASAGIKSRAKKILRKME
jgi:hypothetical protein